MKLTQNRTTAAGILAGGLTLLAISAAWAGGHTPTNTVIEGQYGAMLGQNQFLSAFDPEPVWPKAYLCQRNPLRPNDTAIIIQPWVDNDGGSVIWEQQGRYFAYQRTHDICDLTPNPQTDCKADVRVPAPMTDQHQGHIYPFFTWGTVVLNGPQSRACDTIQAHLIIAPKDPVP